MPLWDEVLGRCTARAIAALVLPPVSLRSVGGIAPDEDMGQELVPRGLFWGL